MVCVSLDVTATHVASGCRNGRGSGGRGGGGGHGALMFGALFFSRRIRGRVARNAGGGCRRGRRGRGGRGCCCRCCCEPKSQRLRTLEEAKAKAKAKARRIRRLGAKPTWREAINFLSAEDQQDGAAAVAAGAAPVDGVGAA